MATFSYKFNGITFETKCYTWQTRRAWGHEVEVYEDGCRVAKKKTRYYNRTWESYEYKCTILGAISSLLLSAKAECMAAFKRERGYKRMTAARRNDFDKYMIHCADLRKYAILYSYFSTKG